MSYFLATHAVIPASRRRVRAICRNYRVNMATDRPSERVGFLFVRGLDGRVLSLRDIGRTAGFVLHAAGRAAAAATCVCTAGLQLSLCLRLTAACQRHSALSSR